MIPPVAHEADELLLGFARALRAAGVPVTQDRSQAYLEAAALVGLHDQPATYWAGRATLCSGPDDLDRYDEVFTAWFHARELDVESAALTLGAVVKYREDAQRVRQALDRMLSA